jgi:hypothetical protein
MAQRKGVATPEESEFWELNEIDGRTEVWVASDESPHDLRLRCGRLLRVLRWVEQDESIYGPWSDGEEEKLGGFLDEIREELGSSALNIFDFPARGAGRLRELVELIETKVRQLVESYGPLDVRATALLCFEATTKEVK